MAQPAKTTEYRLMTLSEIREEANRRLYQANKLRAEYEARARQKAEQATARVRDARARVETDARRLQQQVRAGAQQAAQAGEAGARALGQAVERGAGQVQRGVRQGASRAVQEGRRLQAGAAAAAQRGAEIVGSHIDDLQRRGAQTLDEVAAFGDHARERLTDRADAIRHGAGRAVETAGDYAGAMAQAARTAPHAIGQGVQDWWLTDIRDDQKYFRQLNDYERTRLYRDQGISDPASPEARLAERNELLMRQQAFDVRKAEWDAYPEWKKFAMSLGYGGEDGAFKGGAQMLRAYDRGGRRGFEELYHAEQLPHTFAREEHPIAYVASNIVGSLASDTLLARAGLVPAIGAEVAGAFAQGYLSEPGDRQTRTINGVANVVGDRAADELAEPVQKFLGKQLRKVLGSPPAIRPTVSPRRVEPVLGPDEVALEKAAPAGKELVKRSIGVGTGELADQGANAVNDRRQAEIERNRRARAQTRGR